MQVTSCSRLWHLKQRQVEAWSCWVRKKFVLIGKMGLLALTFSRDPSGLGQVTHWLEKLGLETSQLGNWGIECDYLMVRSGLTPLKPVQLPLDPPPPLFFLSSLLAFTSLVSLRKLEDSEWLRQRGQHSLCASWKLDLRMCMHTRFAKGTDSWAWQVPFKDEASAQTSWTVTVEVTAEGIWLGKCNR